MEGQQQPDFTVSIPLMVQVKLRIDRKTTYLTTSFNTSYGSSKIIARGGIKQKQR